MSRSRDAPPSLSWLPGLPGRITTDEMIEQAQALAAGNDQEFPAHAA
jgi:hypothetical protein